MAAQPPSDQPSWLAAPPGYAAPAATAPPAPEPEPQAAYSYQQPAWVAPPTRGSRMWIYLSGALIVILVLAAVLYVRGQIIANQAANDQIVQPSPSPLISDYERADRFVNTQVAPAFAALLPPVQSVGKECSVDSMVPACKNDLIATNNALLAGQTAFDQADVPICIGPQVGQFKNDWMGMEQGVSEAISGYTDNSYQLYLSGMVKFASIAQYMQADMNRIQAAQKTCSTVVPGRSPAS